MCGTGGGGGVSSLVIVMVAICIMIERVGAAALLLECMGEDGLVYVLVCTIMSKSSSSKKQEKSYCYWPMSN